MPRHLSTAYFPSISWCVPFWNAAAVELEAFENYQKGSLRNRAYIAGPNGLQRLTIPLEKGKHQQTPIREVRIAYDEPWQRQHWRTIKTAYGNAPYFEHYAPELSRFFLERFDFLFDFNYALIQFVLVNKMDWKGSLGLSKSYSPAPVYQDTIAPVFYPQVFQEKHGFLPDLSVLDLLFCCGKHGGEILEKGGNTTPKVQ